MKRKINYLENNALNNDNVCKVFYIPNYIAVRKLHGFITYIDTDVLLFYKSNFCFILLESNIYLFTLVKLAS